jgi:hypothetical protein
VLNSIPFGRLGLPEEVANVVMFRNRGKTPGMGSTFR